MYDILIIGGGPSGLTAALYALRYGLKVALFEELGYGGQAATTPEIENFPSIKHISGFDFASNLHEQVMELGLEYINEKVISADLENKKVKTAKSEYNAKAIIIATGAHRRKLGAKGEAEYSGKGVSYCATCDGAFFKGKDVAIIGGGNTALEDALFLANNCRKVYLIHRRDKFRGIKSLSDRIDKKENIIILFNTQVSEIKGEQFVKSIVTNKEEIPVSGVFIAVGTEPNNSIFDNQIKMDKNGYIIADESSKTSVDGVFAAGDGRTKTLRQIVTACSDGANAAFEAASFIN